MGIEPRRENTRVVEDDEVICAEQIGEIAELSVAERGSWSLKVQQAGGGAVGQCFLRDQLFRKVVVEVGDEHRIDYRAGRGGWLRVAAGVAVSRSWAQALGHIRWAGRGAAA